MQLSIIIVNYNVRLFLEKCLLSVEKACAGIDTEILVVDNNSTDGSREYLPPKFPGIRFIWNETNQGFAKANNQVLKIATGEYILFLNPDTIIPEDCLKKCISYFETHTDTGALGVRMLNGDGKFLKESKRAFPSAAASFWKMAGFARLFPRSKVFAKYYLGHLPETQTNEVDVIAGAFMMIPKKVLDMTGGFDERFFMYAEDIDLSYRIQQVGYKVIYFADTTITHFKGESTNKKSKEHVRLFYKAMHQFVDKHYKDRSAIFRFFVHTGIRISKGFAMITR